MDQGTVSKSKNDRRPLVSYYFDISEVAPYIREFLGWDDELSRALRRLAIENGSAFSFLPEGFHLDNIVDIKWEHEALAGRSDESQALTIKFVTDYLMRNRADGIALFESVYHEGDSILARLTTPHVVLTEHRNARKAICHFLTSTQASSDSIKRAFQEARPFSFVGALTRIPEGWSPRCGSELSVRQVKALARATRHLITEAFDGEVYLIWSRDAVVGRNAVR